MKRFFAASGLFLVILFVSNISWAAADIRGRITNISPVGVARGGAVDVIGTVLIEGKKEADTQVDKASVRVTRRTRLFRLEDGKMMPITFGDLEVGQRVEARFTGPVAESYPAQATAAEIVVLEAKKDRAFPAPPRLDPPDATVREGANVTLVGNLKGGMMGIGGETTGWVLGYQTPQGVRTIDVDVSALRDEPAEGPAKVSGVVAKRHYVERGPTLILRAAKIERLRTVPSDPSEPPPQLQPGAGQAVTVERAREVQNRHTDALMKIPGVVGVGIGIGKTAPIVIKVMVQDAATAANQPIPRELEGVPIEVEVTGRIRAY